MFSIKLEESEYQALDMRLRLMGEERTACEIHTLGHPQLCKTLTRLPKTSREFWSYQIPIILMTDVNMVHDFFEKKLSRKSRGKTVWFRELEKYLEETEVNPVLTFRRIGPSVHSENSFCAIITTILKPHAKL